MDCSIKHGAIVEISHCICGVVVFNGSLYSRVYRMSSREWSSRSTMDGSLFIFIVYLFDIEQVSDVEIVTCGLFNQS